MKKYINLLRVKHYIKNLIIFAPLFFGASLFDKYLLLETFYAFIPFCIGTSIVYIVNDINDVDKDKMHPTKCKRPIASGAISINAAKKFAFVLIIILSVLLIIPVLLEEFSLRTIVIVYAYIFINYAYSAGLKKIPIVDIAILALGFIIRLYYGSFVSGVEVSSWLYLTILGGAFYLGMGKRRNEFQKNVEGNTRDVLKEYNYSFLDKNMYVCLAFTEVTYALWAIQDQHKQMMWTVPIVMLIMMKYSLHIETEDSEGNPIDVFFSDNLLRIFVVIYVMMVFGFIYLAK
ncbi:MAG: UbiA prenyltransferase family protein [Clostridia bacterium]|nr:UbiA prenyltransferase family protein [Clostridia bacterium]